MVKQIEIICTDTGVKREYPLGTSLHDIIMDQNIKLKYPILAALVNNQIKELAYQIFKPKTIRFIDITHKDGTKVYVRSLWYVLMKAAKDLYPDDEMMIEHTVSNGYFCEFNKSSVLDANTVVSLKERMKEIIAEDLPFERKEILTTDLIKIFEKNNFLEKARLFKQSPSLYSAVYSLGGFQEYFYGYLAPSTSYLTLFDLVPHEDGMLLRVPGRKNPENLRPFVKQEKMFDIFQEHKTWARIMNANNIGRINEQVLAGKEGDLIKISEALHEKRVAEIADMIKRKKGTRLILISGPSSSGKTTFSLRLSVQLRVLGLKPVAIALDNYFVNREDTPLDENGEYNFETIDALDTAEFSRNMVDLQAGKAVKMPKFSFETGQRYFDDSTLQIDKDTIIIAEGIHALNPKLTAEVPAETKFKVYISALTQIGIDGHNRIPTTDNRLLRRMIRDYKYRGYSAYDTLKRWDSVRRGEQLNIFPYQENADVMFNSALLYELGVIKKHAEPLLEDIPQDKEEYAEAKRLLKFLSYFKSVGEKEIPPTSILREFLSDSSFSY